jgi:L-alanine-DL-glutamate epimerase-like enolase superfamily enzyme
MISGMMETSLAMTASAHLAVGLGGFTYIDLDTPFFIKDGRRGNPYLSPSGVYDLARVQAGIGVVPE